MNLATVKKILPFFVGAVVLILVILSVLFFSSNSKLTLIPQSQEKPDANQQYIQSFKTIEKQDAPYHAQEQKIAQLITKLPYQGNNFTLKYSYVTNLFTLALKKGHEDEGNKEFDQYLKDNGIPNREALGKLYTDIR